MKAIIKKLNAISENLKRHNINMFKKEIIFCLAGSIKKDKIINKSPPCYHLSEHLANGRNIERFPAEVAKKF